MQIFFDQPETFITINHIVGLNYGGTNMQLMLGAVFIISAVVLYAHQTALKRKKFNEGQFEKYLLIVFLIFWLPIYANSFYNNMYDFYERIPALSRELPEKRISRYCLIDHYQGLGGSICGIFSIINQAKQNVPKGAMVRILADQAILPFFYYNIYPDFKFTKNFSEAEYVLFLNPPDYTFSEGKIAPRLDNSAAPDKPAGGYEIVANLNINRLILKKK